MKETEGHALALPATIIITQAADLDLSMKSREYLNPHQPKIGNLHKMMDKQRLGKNGKKNWMSSGMKMMKKVASSKKKESQETNSLTATNSKSSKHLN